MATGAAREKLGQSYTDDFFHTLEDESRPSAEAIVPLLVELLNPKRVVDVGCGTGSWLAVFRDHGVTDLLGIDGEYVRPEMLRISGEQFVSFDLRKPLHIPRRFDLALCLEVAEHLPAECATTLVESLVGLAPVVLFSAAIPGQGGTHHVNEQWPDYWERLFRDKRYTAIDCIRPRIWESDAVDWYYAQNTLVFVSQSSLKDYPTLAAGPQFGALSVVHPRHFEAKMGILEATVAMLNPRNMSVRQVLALLPSVTRHAIKRRLRKTSL